MSRPKRKPQAATATRCGRGRALSPAGTFSFFASFSFFSASAGGRHTEKTSREMLALSQTEASHGALGFSAPRCLSLYCWKDAALSLKVILCGCDCPFVVVSGARTSGASDSGAPAGAVSAPFEVAGASRAPLAGVVEEAAKKCGLNRDSREQRRDDISLPNRVQSWETYRPLPLA